MHSRNSLREAPPADSTRRILLRLTGTASAGLLAGQWVSPTSAAAAPSEQAAAVRQQPEPVVNRRWNGTPDWSAPLTVDRIRPLI
jgi:hypothetical protein